MIRAAAELRKRDEIVSSYSARGYEVIVEPTAPDVPGWVANFRVDLLARRDDDLVLVEIKSPESLRESDSLRQLAKVVDEHPEWRLELVMTKGRSRGKGSAPAERLLPSSDVSSYSEAATALIERGLLEPAFLSAWIAFETAYRRAFERDGVDPNLARPSSVLKTLLSLGYVSTTDELDQLRLLWDLRNRLAHGYVGDLSPSHESVSYLLDLAERLLRDSEYGKGVGPAE
jgi:hypothetical protein